MNMKQIFYTVVTNPIAKVLDFVNIPKQLELKKRRKEIAWKNKKDYIETTVNVLMEKEVQDMINKGIPPHPLILPLMIMHNIDKAEGMFAEKKKNGDFDELNMMVK